MQAKKDWKDKKRHCEKGEKREFPVAYGTQIADNQQLESQSVKVRNDQAAQSFIPAKPYCWKKEGEKWLGKGFLEVEK